jgi:hypothetical protein
LRQLLFGKVFEKGRKWRRGQQVKKRYRLLIIFQILVFAGFVTYASDDQTEEIVAKLRWLNDADASEMFAHDIQSGTLQFYAVYDAGRNIPGIGHLNYAKCYKKYVLLETIKGCDSCINLEHYYLNQDARIFSAQYNELMRQYLQAHHLSDCADGCDWGGARSQLTMFIRENTEDMRWYSYSPVIVDEEENNILIRLENIALTQVIKHKACQQFASCENAESLFFSITEYNENRIEVSHIISKFTCLQGELEE